MTDKPVSYRYGTIIESGRTRFRLWAPDREVSLEIRGLPPMAMQSRGDGWREADADAPPGTRYRFRMGDMAAPDPASRAQDGDVHGWSIVTDHDDYSWRHADWRGLAWEETVLYEVHPGLMGGFDGIAARLAQWKSLGITAIELMPVAEFPGARSWGYDGVFPFAPDGAYGTPAAFKSLIDSAHRRGMMIFLDVVYNHFGPDGNYLAQYASGFFRNDRQTPWGGAIDFRNPHVRRFFIENALYWVHEFRIDGLRFDAVHAIGADDLLVELAAEVRESLAGGRHIHLVIENDRNDARLIENGFDAQWNDDFHHVLHVLLTGECRGYYADYADAPADKLARALAAGFVYQGEESPYRDGALRGTPSGHLPPSAFVNFLQNHDQIGNRALGERLTTLADAAALKAATALMMLSPQIPLLFMGEEAGATEPFLYFTDHRDRALADSVREGRRNEFARFPKFADPAVRARIPDPNAPETFARSCPRFDGEEAQSWRGFYADLIGVRRAALTPRLKGARSEGAKAVGPASVVAKWRLGDGALLTIACNLAGAEASAVLPSSRPIWGAAPRGHIPPMTTLAWVEP